MGIDSFLCLTWDPKQMGPSWQSLGVYILCLQLWNPQHLSHIGAAVTKGALFFSGTPPGASGIFFIALSLA